MFTDLLVRNPCVKASLRAACLAVVIAGVFVSSMLSSPASAHTDLASSNPPSGSTLRAVPDRVSLTFTEEVSTQFSQLTLTVRGETLALTPDAESAQTLSAAVNPNHFSARSKGATASWTLAYRVVAVDGHPIEGRVRFSAPLEPLSPSHGRTGIAADDLTTDAPSTDRDDTFTPAGAGALTVGLLSLTVVVVALRVRSGRKERSVTR